MKRREKGAVRRIFAGILAAALLTGSVGPEIYDHARQEPFAWAGMLAAQIDPGREDAIRAVSDILLGEGNTACMDSIHIGFVYLDEDIIS